MKNLKVVWLILCIGIFYIPQMNAQDGGVPVEHNIKMVDAPEKVKTALKNYSRYKIADVGTYHKRNNAKIYTFKIVKGKWAKFLLISEKGKILGTKSSEG